MNGYDSGDPEQERAWRKMRRREFRFLYWLLAILAIAIAAAALGWL